MPVAAEKKQIYSGYPVRLLTSKQGSQSNRRCHFISNFELCCPRPRSFGPLTSTPRIHWTRLQSPCLGPADGKRVSQVRKSPSSVEAREGRTAGARVQGPREARAQRPGEPRPQPPGGPRPQPGAVQAEPGAVEAQRTRGGAEHHPGDPRRGCRAGHAFVQA